MLCMPNPSPSSLQETILGLNLVILINITLVIFINITRFSDHSKTTKYNEHSFLGGSPVWMDEIFSWLQQITVPLY